MFRVAGFVSVCRKLTTLPIRPAVQFKVAAVFLVLSGACVFGQTLTTLYHFGSLTGDGTNPQAGVILDQSGNLYGTAALGGASSGAGSIFQLSPPTGGQTFWTETLLHRFRGKPDGKTPESRLIRSRNG